MVSDDYGLVILKDSKNVKATISRGILSVILNDTVWFTKTNSITGNFRKRHFSNNTVPDNLELLGTRTFADVVMTPFTYMYGTGNRCVNHIAETWTIPHHHPI